MQHADHQQFIGPEGIPFPNGERARDTRLSRGVETHDSDLEVVEQPHGTSGETTDAPTLDWASPVNKEEVRQRFDMLSGRVKRSKEQYWNNFAAFADAVGL